MVVLFDEFDAIGKDRASLEEHGEIKRVVNSFLQILDGFRSDTVAIAATNHQGLLDPALWRRFDEIVFFGMPCAAAIEQLLRRNLRQIGVHPAVDLHILAEGLWVIARRRRTDRSGRGEGDASNGTGASDANGT